MRFLFGGLVLSFLAIFPSMAGAQSVITEDWDAQLGNVVCRVGLHRYSDAQQGDFFAADDCPYELRSIKTFTFTDESRTDLILFSQLGLRNMVGALEAHGDWSFLVGQLEGRGVSMRYVSYQEALLNGQQGSVSTARNANCKRYAGSSTCAASHDLTLPHIQTFKTILMRSHGFQSLYSFSGGRGFALDESAQQGSCLTVKKCQWDDNSQAAWCEVLLGDGFRTGYLKQFDHNTVYLSNGC